MFKQTDKKFQFGTDVLSKGIYINEPATNPEATPIYMTTAFNVEVQTIYKNDMTNTAFVITAIAIPTVAP